MMTVDDQVANADISTAKEMNQLVAEYLSHGCFSLTAAAFSRAAAADTREESSAMEVDEALDVNSERAEIKSLVMSGESAEALDRIREKYKEGLEKDFRARFLVQTQLFIELVRRGDELEALHFAQEELGQFASLSHQHQQQHQHQQHDQHQLQCLESLQDVVSLLAYNDPFACPAPAVAHLLSQDRREEVATYLNAFLLTQQKLQPVAALERLVAQTTIVRDMLSEPAAGSAKDKKNSNPNGNSAPAANKQLATHPKWDFATFVGASGSS